MRRGLVLDEFSFSALPASNGIALIALDARPLGNRGRCKARVQLGQIIELDVVLRDGPHGPFVAVDGIPCGRTGEWHWHERIGLSRATQKAVTRRLLLELQRRDER